MGYHFFDYSVDNVVDKDWVNMYPVEVDTSRTPFKISWVILGAFDVQCELSMTWFPFEDHKCYIALATLMSRANLVYLQHSELCMGNFSSQQNQEFAVYQGECTNDVSLIMHWCLTRQVRCTWSLTHDTYYEIGLLNILRTQYLSIVRRVMPISLREMGPKHETAMPTCVWWLSGNWDVWQIVYANDVRSHAITLSMTTTQMFSI